MAAVSSISTHDVFNQSPPFEDVDLFASDRALQEATRHNGVDDAAALGVLARQWGTADMMEQARLANEYTPRLKTFDAKGFRQDIVEFHPAYHAFMTASVAAGLHVMT